jgi:hypothetical protein
VCDLSRQCNRFVFNFDTFQHEKLNTRFEFPRQLNLEPFTREGVAWRRAKAEHDAALAAAAGGDAGDAGGESEAKGGDGDSTSAAAARPGDSVSAGAAAPSGDAGVSAGGDGGVSASGDAAVLEPYTVHPREYYEYRLKGIVVHSGTANSGHYYSFIRDGSPADAALDADDVESLRRERWYRFDDSSVTEFPMTEETLETEAFGGFVEQWETDEYGRAVNVKREQVLCCAVLCCAVLCCAVLCCAVLCCAERSGDCTTGGVCAELNGVTVCARVCRATTARADAQRVPACVREGAGCRCADPRRCGHVADPGGGGA